MQFFTCFAGMLLGLVLLSLCVAGLILHPEKYDTLDMWLTLALILLTSLGATGAASAVRSK